MKQDKYDLIFCYNIKRIRKQFHLTQKQFANKLGVSLYVVRKLEHNIIPPQLTVGILYSIYENFDVSPSKMLEDNR